MSDSKSYYYLKLKEGFFDSEEMQVLQSMPDGYLYSDILLKLYLKSLKDDGRLMFRGEIPYNHQMLATITHHQPTTVEKALKLFSQLRLIDILDNGAIYMLSIQDFIGQSTTEADRIRRFRARIKEEENKTMDDSMDNDTTEERTNVHSQGVQNAYIERTNVHSQGVQNAYIERTNVHQSIEIELENRDIDRDKKKINTKRFQKPTLSEIAEYCHERGNSIDPQSFFDFYQSKGWLVGKTPMKDWKAAIRTWEQRNSNGAADDKTTAKRAATGHDRFKADYSDVVGEEVTL